MGNRLVDFGSWNHNDGPAKKNDPIHDAWVNEVLIRGVKLIFKFLLWNVRFSVRYWYFVLPFMSLGALLQAPGDFFSWIVFFVVTVGCLWYRVKWYKPKVAPVFTEDELEIARYASLWNEVARNAGLGQKPSGTQGVGLYKAYLQLTGTSGATAKLRQAANGTDDDIVIPPLVSVEPAPLGYAHTVALLPGQTSETFAKQADVLASLWLVASVRVTPGVPGQVILTPIVKDPMAGIVGIDQDNYRDFHASVESVEIGTLEDGTPWRFNLGVHSIVAGNSGGGKSVCYRALISQMATVPEVQLILIDLKRGIEAKPFRPRLSVTAKDMDGALEALKDVWELAEQRLDFLEDKGLTDMRDYGFSPEMPRVIVMIDECSELFAVGEPDRELAKQGKEAIALVSKMLRLVRAAGITIIMATQRPSTEVVPSGIRELTQNRVAFRMMNSSGAVMALGELPDNSISPVDIFEHQKGRAVVTDDQGHYSFGQCRFIDPETAKFIAEENALLTTPLSALMLKPEVTDEGENIYEGEII